MLKITLEDEYSNLWDFFENHEDELKGREDGEWEDIEQWWHSNVLRTSPR